METVITIVGFIFGVMGIVLFFKIWTACDNIAEIKRRMEGTQGTSAHQNSAYKSAYMSSEQNSANVSSERKVKTGVKEPNKEAETFYSRELAKLDGLLAETSSVDKKFSILNSFLKKHKEQLLATSTQYTQQRNHKRWIYLFNNVKPLYQNIDKKIPFEFNASCV